MQNVKAALLRKNAFIASAVEEPADPQQVAMYAAFFMEGMRDANYENLLVSWDSGCAELVAEVVGYVPYLCKMVKAVENAMGDSISHPGVLEYEVCSLFGKWFAEEVINRAAPSKYECHAWLHQSVQEFFCQSQSPDTIEAITNVLFDFSRGHNRTH